MMIRNHSNRFIPISKSLIFKRFNHIRQGDVVILRSITNPNKIWISSPLSFEGSLNIQDGPLPHSSIIGLKSRSLVKSQKDNSYIVTHASLEDYINLTPRAAQPIYTYDASTIVNLADIHLSYPELDENNNSIDSPRQYLEAGTGHGSLTLAICSKIHPANCFWGKFGIKGAILHSIDCNLSHSKRGELNVLNFKRGIYKDDVIFHLSESPSSWLQSEIAQEWKNKSHNNKEEGFLDGAFLDMPNINHHIYEISKNLKHDGTLITFVPSITQILDILKTIKENSDIKLTHLKTVQLQPNGLQEWDTRFTYIGSSGEEGMVCRPKVGGRVTGGGFIAIFKKVCT
ncbi:hypothetical protein WICMUC_000438 [Wickerhamomyces mucosus]|uniref:tRNA (adenine(58)-N(1))-methyltransferase catalytic subunit TRM61 n=1 Tax=Wickerhamomyces mucosus TaxID=1378264 RepID=A0A9P8PXZ8_9ASCO|nr:hypothetical protein WICMUC_000438 [Wickerhamomyces mucosus]